MQAADQERAAALYRQREAAHAQARAAQRGQRGGQQTPQMNQMGQARGRRPSDLAPAPGGGGAGNRIPAKNDPASRYRNLKEKATADDDTRKEDGLEAINRLILGLISVVALATVFVLPRQLKVFWVVVLSLTFLLHVGFMLYREWMDLSTHGGEKEKYAEWASVLLYALVMIYTAVMVGILFFMAWSLYSIANSQTNIGKMESAANIDRRLALQQMAPPVV
jgi:hypothetical protein